MKRAIVCCLLFAGCSSGPTPLGNGEYLLTRDYEHFVSTAQRKAVVEATEHCAGLGKTLQTGETTPIPGYYAGFSMRYRCV